MSTEHLITVVFDVTAPTQREAAVIVREVLRMREGSHLRTSIDEVNARGGQDEFLEAWWFPEREDKDVDGNDRPAAHLEWDDQ